MPTPVDELKYPNLEPVKDAVLNTAKNIDNKKPLIVIESTINPGVMEEVVKPILEKNNQKIGETCYLAHCPERINPGDPKWNVSNIPRVIGAFTKAGRDKAVKFYRHIVDANITPMGNIRTAESVKIVENAFRDINIAFVNELAKSFEKLNIDVVEVIRGASTKPFAFMPHFPGCGVGGHCIPVDPYYLIERAKTKGFDHKFLRLAREINESMPEFTVNKIQDTLNNAGMSVKNTKIGLLGLSYKANVGDDRESPAKVIRRLLEEKGARVISYDPYLPSDVESLDKLQESTDVLVIATNHDEFKDLDFNKIKILVDGRNMFHNTQISKKCAYSGIGVHL